MGKELEYSAIYFLGIGGIGMSALARYFLSRGYVVGGYDRTASQLTKDLEREGATVTYEDTEEAIPEAFRVKTGVQIVRTPAVPEDSKQYTYFRENGFDIRKRAEVLGTITRRMRALCVAGTHGKTTTSSMLAHLMYQSEIGTNAFLGGISNNYGTNLLLQPESNYVVVEADEYDRSFHQLTPYIAIVTSVDPDHLDIYGDEAGYREGFEHFTSLIQPGGVLLIRKGLPIQPRLAKGCKMYTYSGSEPADFFAENIQVKNGTITFDIKTPVNCIEGVRLGVPVWVNIENAVAAVAVAWMCGVGFNEIRLGLDSFKGNYRRFNVLVKNEKVVYIDDYAHHPTELKATIDSARRLYPERKLVGVFQPHLYTRTRDFADGFADALSLLDEVILLPIYPAREEPIEGVTSEILLEKIRCAEKCVVEKSEVVKRVKKENNAVVMTLGAGDIDRLVADIVKGLKEIGK